MWHTIYNCDVVFVNEYILQLATFVVIGILIKHRVDVNTIVFHVLVFQFPPLIPFFSVLEISITIAV